MKDREIIRVLQEYLDKGYYYAVYGGGGKTYLFTQYPVLPLISRIGEDKRVYCYDWRLREIYGTEIDDWWIFHTDVDPMSLSVIIEDLKWMQTFSCTRHLTKEQYTWLKGLGMGEPGIRIFCVAYPGLGHPVWRFVVEYVLDQSAILGPLNENMEEIPFIGELVGDGCRAKVGEWLAPHMIEPTYIQRGRRYNE